MALLNLSNLNLEENLDQIQLALGEQNPNYFATEILGLHLNAFNIRFLFSMINHKQVLVICSNQVGKTVSLAILHIWFNFYKRGFIGDVVMIEKSRYETLNLSPITRQSKECYRYIEEILHSQFSWEEGEKRFINECKIGWFFEGKNEAVGRIDFKNNSSVVCFSTSEDKGAGLAGKQFGFISYDECVQSLHLQEELGARIFSRAAKYNAPIVLVATPDDLARSQQYWFHLYNDAKRALEGKGFSEWYLVEGVYDENIFISEKSRRDFKDRLFKQDPIKYAQVIEGKFIATSDRMFNPPMVDSLWNGKTSFTPAVEGHEYVLVIDWGVADQGDETVMMVGDITDYNNVEIVNSYCKQGADPVELMAMATFMHLNYFDCPVVMDVKEMGGTIFKKMLANIHPIGFIQGQKADALFYSQMRLRNNIREDLTTLQKNNIAIIKSYYLPKLEAELSSYKMDDKRIKQDWVMVFSMLCWYIDKYKAKEKIKAYPLTNFYK